MKYAHIILFKTPGAFDGPLTYKIPHDSERDCGIGKIVLAPLQTRQVRGIIIRIKGEEKMEASKIKEIIEVLDEPGLPEESIELAFKIADYYHASLTRILRLMIPGAIWKGGKGTLKKLAGKEMKSLPPKEFPLAEYEHALIEDQEKAVTQILEAKKPVLLHGVTGSGKTEVYLRVILETVRKGNQALLMVPEIALTPQMIAYFRRYFGEHMALFHSRLSEGERAMEWMKVRMGFAPLVIGSRSAVFAPFTKTPTLILDEEHEWTYKQESAPYYQAHTVAEWIAVRGGHLIFGSATPRLETLYKARQGEYEIVTLPRRVRGHDLPVIHTVDLREEFKQRHFHIFSRLLTQKIRAALEKGEQIILFVNQRGMARAVVCRDCGYTATCSHCEVSLTFHRSRENKKDILLCHYCNRFQEMPAVCPQCQSSHIKYVGLGTQRVEEELKALFPKAKALRADKDSTQLKEGFQPLYEAFKKREYDVLIGTQMVAKGLDFPGVTLIGVILADIGLHIPDFRSHERLFQIITQVAGRCGRAEEKGEVILQTYQPDHFAIRQAACYGYEAFIEKETAFRQQLSYPPFSKLIKFTAVGSDLQELEKQVHQEQENLEGLFKQENQPVKIMSAPAMISKVANRYHYHLLLRSENPELIFKRWQPPAQWRIDVDPIHST